MALDPFRPAVRLAPGPACAMAGRVGGYADLPGGPVKMEGTGVLVGAAGFPGSAWHPEPRLSASAINPTTRCAEGVHPPPPW